MFVGVDSSRVRDIFENAIQEKPCVIFIDEIEGVIVIATTNCADILDPAHTCPGRFDRKVYVGLSDQKGRMDIIKFHYRDKPLNSSITLHKKTLDALDLSHIKFIYP